MDDFKHKKINKKTTKKACVNCSAFCCKNLAMEIGKPTNKKEIEDLKWQLHFDTVKVYIHRRKWYQWVAGKCMYLDSNDRCTIYEERPQICRKHNPPDCEHFGAFYDIMIKTPDELEAYLESKSRKIKKK